MCANNYYFSESSRGPLGNPSRPPFGPRPPVWKPLVYMVVEFLETVLLHFIEFELEWKQLNPLRWDESYTLCEIRRGLSYRTVVKLHLYYFRGCSNDVSRSTAEILITVYGKKGVCYAQRHSMSKTRSSATADGPRDAICQSKSCQLLHNSVYGNNLYDEGYSRPTCNKLVHSATTRWQS